MSETVSWKPCSLPPCYRPLLASPCEEFPAVCPVHHYPEFARHRGFDRSLFTCVPTTHAIQVSHERLKNDPSLPDRTSLTVDDICSLHSLCLKATYLAFEGKVYRQIHGTAIGSSVSIVVAKLVMEDIEREALSTFHTLPSFGRDTSMTHAQHFLWTWQTPFAAI